MSKNNKNSTRNKQAKAWSAQRVAGTKGPAKTQSKHGKQNAWWQKFESYALFIAAGGK